MFNIVNIYQLLEV